MDIITATVRDRNGRVISRERHKVKSFVRAYNHLLNVLAYAYGSTKDIGGVLRLLGGGEPLFQCDAPIGETDYGIRIGTDGTGVNIEDYAMLAAIAEGVGAGQMSHQAMVYTDLGVVGNVCSFEAERVIVNNSGGAIAVAEVGIYCRALSATIYKYFMIARDIVSQSVPDGGAITVTYTIRVVA
ncbi:hypothetical protein ES703_104490 [subsurface metagenome]